MWKFIGAAAGVIVLAVLLVVARGPVIAAFLLLAFILAEPENKKIRPLLLRPFTKRKAEIAAPSDSTLDTKGEKHVEAHAV
jgi:hypothetical protein